jgi:DNA oxidative demethylase
MTAQPANYRVVKLFDIDRNPLQRIENENLNLRIGRLCSKVSANELFEIIESETEYYSASQSQVEIRGRKYRIPRQQVAYGEEGVTYTYNKNTVVAKSWTPALSTIKKAVERKLEVVEPFNFALINRYKDGFDSVGLHKDDEKELDVYSPIASVSLGEPRKFVLESDNRGKKPVELMLNHGTLLSMDYPTNAHWRHSIPKDPRVKRVRLNITFRVIRNEKK